MFNFYNNIANIITVSGFIIVNLNFFFYLQTNNKLYIYLCLFGFLFDTFDGIVARKLQIKSELGNILDKLSDKINQNNVLLFLYYKYNLSLYYYYIFLIRELSMYISRIYGYRSIYSSVVGKIKTFLFPLILLPFIYDLEIKYLLLNILSVINIISLLC